MGIVMHAVEHDMLMLDFFILWDLLNIYGHHTLFTISLQFPDFSSFFLKSFCSFLCCDVILHPEWES